MQDATGHRRLTIGAYASATQLTAKALRLYDEYGLLRPISTDPATGYRYYRAEQVATGRLIRSLRDMNCSLSQIARVLEAPAGMRPSLLRDFLQEAEKRLARERTAYQAALLMMRPRYASDVLRIEVMTRPDQIVTVTSFTSNRRDFIEHAIRHRETTFEQLRALGLNVRPEFTLSLVEPLTDDDGRVELLCGVGVIDRSVLHSVTTRHIQEQQYASTIASASDLTDGFTACVDGLFDWFDKCGAQALGFPEVVLAPGPDELRAQVQWAFHDRGVP